MKERVAAAGKWVTETAWPAITSAYKAHEGVRQFVTFVVGVIVGWVVR